MTGSTISTTITVGVTLGSAGYTSPLTITSTGAIAPVAAGATALYATLGAQSVLNQGAIAGGLGSAGASGAHGGTGGLAVALVNGILSNAGMIAGGAGGTGGEGSFGIPSVNAGAGGLGGTGVEVTTSSLTNSSTIVGGAGGSGGGGSALVAGGTGGAGGVGLDLVSGSVTNTGVIAGGGGGTANLLTAAGGAGGSGAYVLAGTLTNVGSIAGGSGGLGAISIPTGAGGVGVRFKSGGTLTNAGSIGGGIGAGGGADAIYFGSGASRLILDPGARLSGAVVANAAFYNTLELASAGSAGTLSGGIGTEYQEFNNILVDTGATWTLSASNSLFTGSYVNVDGSLVNDGTIADSGGTPVYLANGELTNNGTIVGNATNGIGVFFGSGGSLTNTGTGTITARNAVDGNTKGAATIVNAGDIAGHATIGSGIALRDGGSVTNQAGGTISGNNGIYGKGAITIVNSATIAGNMTSGTGAYLTSNGFVTNSTSGAISGLAGVGDAGTGLTVANTGRIWGNATAGWGVLLRAGGTVINHSGGTNQSGGSISGKFGVYVEVDAGTVTNSGTITGSATATAAAGVDLLAGGEVANQNAGTISGYDGIRASGTLMSVVNDGGITGNATAATAAGVALFAGGEVTNDSLATIAGYRGVYGHGAAITVMNSGLVTGDAAPTATAAAGVVLTAGGSVTNTNGGTIAGRRGVWGENAALTVVNGGTIIGDASTGSGILLAVGGSVTNQSGGLIGEFFGIYSAGGAVTVIDAGTIIGNPTGGAGIDLQAGGSITVEGGGTVSASTAIYGASGAATVIDAGMIIGNPTRGEGINLQGGGSITVEGGGTVAGNSAIYGVDEALTIDNSGSVAGIANGIWLVAGGSVTNQPIGVIAGYRGIAFNAGGTVVNSGGIVGSTTGALGDGVLLSHGGTLTNQSGGTVSGYIGFNGSGATTTVVNAGTIRGVAVAVRFGTGQTNRMVIDPGAVFSGIVNGGNTIGASAVSTLELASSAAAGTLSGLGSRYVNFAQVAVDAAASWVLAGADSIAAGVTLTNLGALTLGSGATLTDSGLLRGPLMVAAGAELANTSGGTVNASGPVAVYGLAGGAATILNAGVIASASTTSGQGISLAAGGVVTNQSGGTITGDGGIYGTGGATTVVNAGLIVGAGAGGDAIRFGGTYANRVVVDPASVFVGTVDGGGTRSTLEFSGEGGTIVTVGTQFVNFGTLQVDAAADWTVQGANHAGSLAIAGALTIGGPATLSASVGATVSGDSSAPARVVVTAGGLLNDAGQLVLGAAAGGSLLVSEAGQATAASTQEAVPAVILGASASGDGVLQVSDAGSTFTASGQVDVGAAGTGSLLVENHATVMTGGATAAVAVDVGTQAGASGSVTVSGDQSLLSNTGEFVIGDAGLGSLLIQSGATVTSTLGAAPAAAVIADNAGAAGSLVNVTGAESGWRIDGSLVVGNAAEGSLNIAGGGTVSAATLDVGAQKFGSGLVSINGDGSSLFVVGTLSVGGAGSGELSILSGANVNIGGDFDIGQTAGGTGDVDIENPGGTVFVGGNLNLGDGAAGVLTVGPNSTLEVDNGGVIAGPHGVENLFSAIDPFFSDGGTANILDSADQTYKAYVESTSFNLSPGISYTLNTPIIYGSSGFALGVNSSDTSGVTLILNADSLSAASNVTFNDALSTLVIGADVLPSIELPASGTGPFTAAANPNLGLPLIGGFAGTIKDFQVGDTIVVDTKVAATFHQNGSLVSVIANSTTLGVLTFDSLAHATLAVITPGALVDQAPCFAAGTRIATERGEVAVEDLRVGDLVRVVLGGGTIGDGSIGDGPMGHLPTGDQLTEDRPMGNGLAPVIWVGRREVDCTRHPKPRTVWPVRVAAGVFGPGQPHSDLLLSPDHAVYVGEVLIPVKHLINGSTIVQVPVDRIVYHHIELAQHDVVLAQGLPAESFLDMRDGTNYANRPGPVQLYPDFSARMWEAFGCARLVVTGPELEATRALVARFAEEREAA